MTANLTTAIANAIVTSTMPPAGYPNPAGITILASTTFAIFGTIGTVLYIPIMIVIARKREKFSSPYYTLLFALGIGELYTLFRSGWLSAFCVARAYMLNSPTCQITVGLDRILGWLAWFTWIAEYPFDVMIAFDRLVAVVFFLHHKELFTRKRVLIMCAVAWLYALIISSPIMVWYLPVSFIEQEMTADMEHWGPNEGMWGHWNTIFGTVLIVCSVCLYGVTVMSLIFRQLKKKFRVKAPAKGNNAQNLKPEIKLLIQCFLRFLLLVADIIFCNLQSVSTIWTFYVQDLICVFLPINTAVVILCLNSEVRHEVGHLLKLIGCARNVSVTATSGVGSAVAKDGGGTDGIWATKRTTTGGTLSTART